MGSPVHFRQFASTVVLTQQAGLVDTLGSLAFVVSQITNMSGFADIWDMYKVEYLEYNFRPQVLTVPGATTSLGSLYTVVDKDDSTTPSSITVLREYSSLQTHTNEPFTCRFKPGILTGAWNGSVVVAAVSSPPPWLDCAQTGILHYGMKYCLQGGVVGQTLLQTWFVDLFVGISFRNVH